MRYIDSSKEDMSTYPLTMNYGGISDEKTLPMRQIDIPKENMSTYPLSENYDGILD